MNTLGVNGNHSELVFGSHRAGYRSDVCLASGMPKQSDSYRDGTAINYDAISWAITHANKISFTNGDTISSLNSCIKTDIKVIKSVPNCSKKPNLAN
jgi:hypothetical protein